jgi:hypothetical protein
MRNLLRTTATAAIFATVAGIQAQTPTATYNITVNTALNRKAINPLIYGVAWATQAQLQDLNSPANRMGGNATSRYNWQINADNSANDWYYESIGDASAVAGQRVDSFIQGNKAAGAQSLFTVPMIPWVAKLGPSRSVLSSFSVAKYGAQTGVDPYDSDAGNGISTAAGNPFITGNDPNDANVPNSVSFEQGLLSHLVSHWGKASAGGLKYYLMDNESSIWFSTHRDVHPVGPKMDEILNDIVGYSTAVKATDSSALVCGPEEWGWDGYFYSGYDQQYGAAHGYSSYPDRAAHGNLDYVVYLLQQLKAKSATAGVRLLDVFSLHAYPQDGSFSDDVSASAVAIRNQSTRSLWDPNYLDQSWINDKIQLIPRMQSWVNTYYPGTQVAITEYNWGAEGNINGATTQADIFGIFGAYGLNMATRWTTPDASTPTYKAMKMYRNYDGHNSGFGDMSVSDTGSNPDDLASYAATRTADGYLTVMLINKIATPATVNLSLSGFTGNGTAQVWQLTSANVLARAVDLSFTTSPVAVNLPAQCVTLLVFPPSTVKIVAPPIPTGLTGFPLPKKALLQWASTNGASQYRVFRSLNGTTYFDLVGTPTTTSFTDVGLANGTPYYYEIEASNTAGHSLPTSSVKVTPQAVAADTAPYNFEGGPQGWVSSGGLITHIGASLGQHFLGSYALAVAISATGSDAQTVSVASPSVNPGQTVTFHVWLPAGCKLSGIQPYVLQNAAGGWTWTGNWQNGSSLDLGAWNTLTVTVPSGASPLYSLGVQFNSNVAWSGVCYVDSISWK